MADRAAISDLISKFAWTYDEGRFDEHADCFVPGCVFVIQLPGQAPIRIEGRDAIVDLQASSHKQQGDQRRHVMSNLRFEMEEAESAQVASYLTLGVVAGGRVRVAATGTFRDKVVLDGGAWRFAERVLSLDTPPQ